MKEAILKVDLDSILYNYRHLKCYYKKNIIAVLKDNAYGVGLIEVMKTLRNEDGLIIAVNHLNDIKTLRENNYTNDIIYLNVFDQSDIDFIIKNDVSVIIDSLKQLKLLKNTNIKFHLKFNTGMNRLGLNEKDAIEAIRVVNSNPSKYNLVGVMTHFADEDKDHSSYFIFEKYVKMLKKENLIIHCYASSSLNENFENITNYIRVGLKLYGIGERNTFLHVALTLNSPILTTKKILQNQMVGYDYEYTTPYNGYLYILPIGYGQGWGKFYKSFAYLDFNYLQQAGKISMDYSTYFSKKDYSKSDEYIELFGKNIPLESICKVNKIDPHEILVRLKVKKEYHKLTLK